VVLATHTPLGLSVLHTLVAPYRSYVIAFHVHGSELGPGLYWDTADPYHYLRAFAAGQGRLLILGGADRKTGHDEGQGQEPYLELERYARERFDVASIDYRWSSQYYDPSDGLPYIGKGVLGNHVYMATGYSGDGTVFGTVAGVTLADEILGRRNPWARLYSATRVKPLASAKHFITENLNVAKHFVKDWMGRGEHKDVGSVALGEARIVDLPEGKTAVYRDLGGTAHAYSAVCPHAKCIVHWNPTEQTWDCPCHGSRFSPTSGAVLEGPALDALPRHQTGEER
jgi:Rieske Fe-S protein